MAQILKSWDEKIKISSWETEGSSIQVKPPSSYQHHFRGYYLAHIPQSEEAERGLDEDTSHSSTTELFMLIFPFNQLLTFTVLLKFPTISSIMLLFSTQYITTYMWWYMLNSNHGLESTSSGHVANSNPYPHFHIFFPALLLLDLIVECWILYLPNFSTLTLAVPASRCSCKLKWTEPAMILNTCSIL